MHDVLTGLIGEEHRVDDVARNLYAFASGLHAAVVGALLLTCADESEQECIAAFHHCFAEHLLPALMLGKRSQFQLANLGGRYEVGAVNLADAHYGSQIEAPDFKLLVVKVNSHVAVEPSPQGPRFGTLKRYGQDSECCGALHATLQGSELPFALDLRDALTSGGIDRVATLLDTGRVPGRLRALFAAIASAHLHAARAIADIRSQRPPAPTRFVVIPAVTINRPAGDTEIVCALWEADWRNSELQVDYQGLGDDPARYRLTPQPGRLRVTREP